MISDELEYKGDRTDSPALGARNTSFFLSIGDGNEILSHASTNGHSNGFGTDNNNQSVDQLNSPQENPNEVRKYAKDFTFGKVLGEGAYGAVITIDFRNI